jgi:PAS domain S-box-containing protein
VIGKTISREELERRLVMLEEQLQQQSRFAAINQTLFKIANAINETADLDELFSSIHQALCLIIDTTNFYIALYDASDDSLTFPYIVDTVDTCYPPVIEVSKTASLTAEVIRTKAPLLVTKAEILARQAASTLTIPACTPSEIWLGVPLRTQNGIVGVMAVQHYQDAGRYDQTDLTVLVAVADQVAVAIERKQLEKALRDSEQIFRQLIETASDAIYLIDEQGHIIRTNSAAARMLGRTVGEMSSLTLDMIDANFSLSEFMAFWRSVPDNEPLIFESSHIRADGSLVPVEISGAKFTVNGKGCFYGIARDISGRKHAEEVLRDSEERYRLLSDLTMEGIVIHKNGMAIDLNSSMADMLGYRREELFAKDFLGFVHEDDRALVRANLAKDYASPYVVRMLRANGEYFYAEIEARNFQQKGDTWRVSAIRDITERKRAEEALRESEERFQKMLGLVPDMISIHDPEMNILYSNWQGFAAVPEDRRRRNSKCFRTYRGLDDVCPDCQAGRVLQTGQPFQEEVALPEGSWIDLRVIPLLDEQGDVEIFMEWVRDITLQKKAEENQKRLQVQLTQAQKMESVGRLAGGVAHDFNNMLGVILGYTELAVNHVPADTRLGEYLQQIHGAAKRSADMTQQLLAFARKQTIAPKVLDLNETVAGMITMLHRLIGENIDLVWRPAPEVVPVKMDPSQLDQIMANLCVNARDAISGVGRLTIETAPAVFDQAYCADRPEAAPGAFARLTVSDDGCGMDRQTLEKLFEPFFTTKEIGAGTGLGLATVYGIVKQNDGFVEVESTPGIGTTFHLFLPLYREDADSGPQRVAPPRTTAGSETVLLVEDEPMILEMTTMMLELQGYRVLPAGKPTEALRLADEHAGEIHLLITDVIMPEMNGRDLAARLQAGYPRVKCLFMSGYTASVIGPHGVLDEGFAFIQKPFSMSDLCNRVRDVLDARRSDEQNAIPQ